jgi:serine/threonine protein phosphatase PrpC
MYGATDVGLVRSSNQDSYYCNADQGLVILSDGMGGHKGGEIASQMTVNGLRDAYQVADTILLRNVSQTFEETLKRINAQILEHSNRDPSVKGMGATVNFLQFMGDHVVIGHAGDSRTYLVRAHRKSNQKIRFNMWCLTVDHNVGTFVERGILIPGRDIPSEPLTERQKSRLMKGMGVVEDLVPDLYCRETLEHDIYITCSDGLHGYVSDREILRTVASGPIAKAAQRLVDMAKKAGAPDNVTIVVSVVSDLEEPLRDVPGPPFDPNPFIIRSPSGEIRGPTSCKDIIQAWLSGTISNQSEVAAGGGSWVFLEQREELFRHYSEFDVDEVRRHFAFFQSSSHLESTENKEGVSIWVVILGVLFVLLTIVSIYLFFENRQSTQDLGHFLVKETQIA